MPKRRSRGQHTFSRHVAPLAPLALALLMQSSSGGGGGTPTTATSPTVSVESGEEGAGFSQSCSNPHFPPNSGPTTIDVTSCTIDGNGGSETFQNEAKNNFCAPGPPVAKTVSELLNLQTQVQHDSAIPFGRSNNHPFSAIHGPATDRKPLQSLGEGTQVTVQGFVLIARQEGGESVNCGKRFADIDTNHDIHISIVDSTTQKDECSSVVAEMVPHHRPASWTEHNVNLIAGKKLLVRVTGQLLFDSSHSPCKNGKGLSGDPKRLSLWEIHPIYEFDVCPQGDCSTGEDWVTLEEFLKQ